MPARASCWYVICSYMIYTTKVIQRSQPHSRCDHIIITIIDIITISLNSIYYRHYNCGDKSHGNILLMWISCLHRDIRLTTKEPRHLLVVAILTMVEWFMLYPSDQLDCCTSSGPLHRCLWVAWLGCLLVWKVYLVTVASGAYQHWYHILFIT